TDMNVLAFMFDFVAGSSNVGDGSAGSTFYFDEVKYANVPLGSDEGLELAPISVYPNPASDLWTLSNPTLTITDVIVFSIDGKLLEKVEPKGDGTVDIDASLYPAGIYLAKVITTTGEEVLKLYKD
ncbi:MAG: T9SS C-terminal target domain-containing protein, partial [Bacteroidetes bacterium]